MSKSFSDKIIALNELLELKEELLKSMTPQERSRQKHLEAKMKDPDFKANAKKAPNTKEAYKAPKADFQGKPPTKPGTFHGEAHETTHVNGHRHIVGIYNDANTGEKKGSRRQVDNKVKTVHAWDHTKKKWEHRKTEHSLGGLNVDGSKKGGPSMSAEDKSAAEKNINDAAKKQHASQKKYRSGTTREDLEEAKNPKPKEPKKIPPLRRKKSDVSKLDDVRAKLARIRGQKKLSKTEEIKLRLEELKKAAGLGGIGGPGAIKAGASLPGIKTPSSTVSNMSSTPSTGTKQASTKNPMKQAEQTQNKDIKDIKLKEAQAALASPSMQKEEGKRLSVKYTKEGGNKHNWHVNLGRDRIGMLHHSGEHDDAVGGAVNDEHKDLLDHAAGMATKEYNKMKKQELVKHSQNGQWSLEKTHDPDYTKVQHKGLYRRNILDQDSKHMGQVRTRKFKSGESQKDSQGKSGDAMLETSGSKMGRSVRAGTKLTTEKEKDKMKKDELSFDDATDKTVRGAAVNQSPDKAAEVNVGYFEPKSVQKKEEDWPDEAPHKSNKEDEAKHHIINAKIAVENKRPKAARANITRAKDAQGKSRMASPKEFTELRLKKNGQWEFAEDLEKGVNGKRFSGSHDDHAPFSHGSTVKIHRAVSDDETGKTHGYEVHETKHDGSVQVHKNIPHGHLDSAMAFDGRKARLRMGGERSTKKHNLYHEASVEVHRDAGKPTHHLVLKPHGEPHTLNVKED